MVKKQNKLDKLIKKINLLQKKEVVNLRAEKLL